MKLTSLEIFGFKSFAERTKFLFDKGITGIVGPNGCGKSNVIDSIRWVLGEQRTRSLRSEKMENVIFNGTERRRKANFAEVAITFENTKNLLPTAYTTVTVTRRLFRDGDSEYLLNSVPCRLKDVNNLFLDTGIGPDSYAIIELGMIDGILNDKNNSRRQLFEEAAGVSRYKIRKKETFLRLEETEKSLERVDDVLFEIEKNLKTLEKQAKRAEQYFEIKEQYKRSGLRFAYLKTAEIRAAITKLEAEADDHLQKASFADARIAKHEARVSELQLEVTVLEQALAENQKEYNALVDKIRKIENEKALRAERNKNLSERIKSIENQISAGHKRKETLAEQMAALEPQIDAGNEAYDQLEFYLVELETEQEELKKAVHNRKLQVDEAGRELKSKENALNNQYKEIDKRTALISGLEKELQRNRNDLAQRQAETQTFSLHIETVAAEVAGIEAEYQSLLTRREQIENQITAAIEKTTALNEQLFRARGKIDAKKHEYKLLKDLVENLEGFPESVKFLKQKLAWTKDAPLISDIFYCETEYKVAIENYLEAYMNYFLVNEREKAVEAVRLLQSAGKGRANFFILDEIDAFYATAAPPVLEAPPGSLPALKIVEYAERYQSLARYLFENASVVVDNDAWPSNEGFSGAVVLKTGNMQMRKFTLSGGSVGLFEGKRIGRAKNLEILQNEISDFENERTQIETALAEIKTEAERLRKEKNNRALEDCAARLQKKKDERTAQTAKAGEAENVLTRLKKRAAEIEQEIKQLQKEIDRYRPSAEDLQNEINDLYRQLNVHQRELSNRSEAFSVVNTKYNKENLRFLDTKNLIANLKKDFRTALEQTRQIEKNEIDYLNEIETHRFALERLETEATSGEDEIFALYEEKKQKETDLAEREQRAKQAKTAVQQNENFIRTERKQKDEILSQRNDLKDKATKEAIKLNAVIERTQVEWQLEIDALNPAELFENDVKTYKLSEVEAQMMRLREKFTKFGEVNPTAIESYLEIKERYDTTFAQKEDIISAKKELLETIKEIDEVARVQFMDSFIAIRENFVRVFRTLFTENDACDLILVNENDPLESPIEIIARPKGKRPLTINQLSGGEKTLTATSLLFAIYLLKPAPFCIFDEVDAPLDDANIDKFNNIIREFSNQSQFIIVTHNKRSMTQAHILYGVTMEELGVSRVLPVDLSDLRLN